MPESDWSDSSEDLEEVVESSNEDPNDPDFKVKPKKGIFLSLMRSGRNHDDEMFPSHRKAQIRQYENEQFARIWVALVKRK